MKSKIRTVDALLTEEKSYPVKNTDSEPFGVRMEILGFSYVQYREKPQRPISKIINPLTMLYEK
jgi:hypothetical protein